ncbi:DUF6538 domain-containing protein [Camelimonas sp. ID_303_24]
MPRRPEHLQLRGRIYWIRVRVPDELRHEVGRIEIRRSLGTSDPTEAKGGSVLSGPGSGPIKILSL